MDTFKISDGLEGGVEELIRFQGELVNFLGELVDLKNPDIDALFDKYQVVVKDQYPRG